MPAGYGGNDNVWVYHHAYRGSPSLALRQGPSFPWEAANLPQHIMEMRARGELADGAGEACGSVADAREDQAFFLRGGPENWGRGASGGGDDGESAHPWTRTTMDRSNGAGSSPGGNGGVCGDTGGDVASPRGDGGMAPAASAALASPSHTSSIPAPSDGAGSHSRGPERLSGGSGGGPAGDGWDPERRFGRAVAAGVPRPSSASTMERIAARERAASTTRGAVDWSNPELPTVAQLRAAGARRRDANSSHGFKGYRGFFGDDVRPEELVAAGAAAGGKGTTPCEILPARRRGRERQDQGPEVWQNNSFHILAFQNRR